MSRRDEASGNARLFLFAVTLLLCGCSKHAVQYATPWLRVDVVRPRADETIRVGSIEERYEVKSGGRWKKLGVGHRSGYTILGEEPLTAPAVVVHLDEPRGEVLVRPDAPPRRLLGQVCFPNAVTVDVLQYTDRDARIERYDAVTRQTRTLEISIPTEYSGCRIDRLLGYADGVPYVLATCDPPSSRARCVLLAAGKPAVLYTVRPDQPQTDCDFAELHLSLQSPAYRHFQ